jgi:GNAT superfamily N-acetyltransferase
VWTNAGEISRLTGHLGYEVSPADVSARLSRMLGREDQQFLVAELNGRPVGWIHVGVAEYIETGAFAAVNGLVVDRDVRSRGVGQLLLERAEEWARDRDVPLIRLWSTTSREGAHRFYERQGYMKIKTQYAFVKSLRPGQNDFGSLIPRVKP